MLARDAELSPRVSSGVALAVKEITASATVAAQLGRQIPSMRSTSGQNGMGVLRNVLGHLSRFIGGRQLG